MVGNHKSGRKPSPEGASERSKKYTFYVRWDVQQWKNNHHWRCKCEPIGILQNYKHNRVDKCHACGSWKNKAAQVAQMSQTQKAEYYKELMGDDSE